VPSDKVWKIKKPSPFASTLALETGLSPLQTQLLINRGMSDKEAVQSFLHLRLADMADPMLMKGMSDVLPLILKTAENMKRITIFGDYDADGLTATALLYNLFSDLDIPVSYYIPDRLEEGYGLNNKAIEKINGDGTGLIITVDCGISNEREIAFAQSLGMDVIVTDHHQMPDNPKLDCPVINPHQPGCPFPFKDLAGVGVAFFFAVAVRAGLREKGWFRSRTEPDLKEYLDLVALGTVADRVPLTGQNRILVNSGLETLAGTRWAGMKAMMEVADIGESEVSAEDLAFRLAPRLNAPGRIGESSLGIQALTTREAISAKNLALRINSANSKRQDIERDIYDSIEDMIEKAGGLGERRTLLLGAEGWHKGVLGIVASRLVDKYYRPSLIYNIRDGMAVGSGRSIDGFNLFRVLNRLKHFFEKFGGHSHAAGFTIKVDNLGAFERELDALAREMLSDDVLIPSIDVDAELSLRDITRETIHQIRSLSPFGAGNPEPNFVARSLDVLESRIVGERHVKFKVRQAGEGNPLEAIGFGLGDKHPLEGRTIDMVFTPELNRWQGYENIQLRVIDLSY
jgi:single-stranded-DNA-specific exonuclease